MFGYSVSGYLKHHKMMPKVWWPTWTLHAQLLISTLLSHLTSIGRFIYVLSQIPEPALVLKKDSKELYGLSLRVYYYVL